MHQKPFFDYNTFLKLKIFRKKYNLKKEVKINLDLTESAKR